MMNGLSFIPELYFFAVIVFLLGWSFGSRPGARGLYPAALALAALGVVICLGAVRQQSLLFAGTYRVDLYSQVFKVLLALGLFLAICLCSDLQGVSRRRHSDVYLLLVTCTLAMMLLVSSVHLLSIYVALELSSYSLYVLVALRRDRKMGIEAGLKYFLIGASASAVMLFGIALLYGTIQVLTVTDLARVLPGAVDRPLVLIGLLLTLGGFFFKLAVFPFHFWAPDVYQGAANPVAAYIATASKAAAIAVIIRFVAVTGGGSVVLPHVLAVLAVISMTVGNLAAIVQKDFKRLLAYSSIAHAGYVLVGILSMRNGGYAAAAFYALAVVLMKFTCFMVLVKVASGGGNLRIDQLAGIPPTIGFTAKLLIFVAAVQQGYIALVLIAMVNVVISLYYYLLAVKAAYLLEPPEPLPPLRLSPLYRLLAGLLIVGMVTAGIYPAPLLRLFESAVQYLV
jgi:NADH-quinone oxidoreductase subunit N